MNYLWIQNEPPSFQNGLFTKWHRYMMEDVRKNLRRQKEELEGNDSVETGGDRALSVSHMQGPFLILCSGLGLAGFAFLVEMVLGWFSGSRFACDSGCVYMLDPMIKRYAILSRSSYLATKATHKHSWISELTQPITGFVYVTWSKHLIRSVHCGMLIMGQSAVTLISSFQKLVAPVIRNSVYLTVSNNLKRKWSFSCTFGR